MAKKKTTKLAKKRAVGKKKPASEQDEYISTRELAEHVGITRQAIEQQTTAGVIEQVAPGRYDLIDSLTRMVKHKPNLDLREQEIESRIWKNQQSAIKDQTTTLQLQKALIFVNEVTVNAAQYTLGVVKILQELERNVKRVDQNVSDPVLKEIRKGITFAMERGKRLCDPSDVDADE